MTETNKANILSQLAEGIAQLTTSDKWREWLNMQSRFHRYSFNNTLLILHQKPVATRVAGYNAWRQFNRFVRKGEKGIWILAPMVYKTEIEERSDTDEVTRVIRGFKPVAVFDVSQTDGEELPEICSKLSGDDPSGAYGQLIAVANSIGFAVEEYYFDNGINGDCAHDLKRIRIEARNDQRQQVKTLAHELGHALLHEPGPNRPTERALLELEAESVAYVVCQNLGIESGDYSFGYVATWAGSNDDAQNAIRASGTRIQQAADRILTALSEESQAQEVA